MAECPIEVFRLILEELTGDDGMLTLWIMCRQVSKTWRAMVEKIFISKHLPVTSIIIYLPLFTEDEDIPEGGTECDFNADHRTVNFRFSHLATDSEGMAVFTYRHLDTPVDEDDCITPYSEELCNYYKEAYTRSRLIPQVHPLHVVCCRRFANDTALLNCEITWTTVPQLRCDWLSLLTNLLIEEYRIRRAMKEKISDNDLRLAYDSTWPETDGYQGATNMCKQIFDAVERINKCREDSIALERRRRHAECRRTFGLGGDWVESDSEEEDALLRIMIARYLLLHEEYDDDAKGMSYARAQRWILRSHWINFEMSRIEALWLNVAIATYLAEDEVFDMYYYRRSYHSIARNIDCDIDGDRSDEDEGEE